MKYRTGRTDTGKLTHASRESDMYKAMCGVSLCFDIREEVEDDVYWDVNCYRCRRSLRAGGIPW